MIDEKEFDKINEQSQYVLFLLSIKNKPSKNKKMKIYLCLILSLIFQTTFAQFRLDIVEMNLSKLNENSYTEKITNGKDTTTIVIHESGEINSPYIGVEMKMKNITDSLIAFHIKKSSLYITYSFEGKQYRKNMDFYIEQGNNMVRSDDIIKLCPNQEFTIFSSGYIAEGAYLERKFLQEDNNTLNMMKILPTLKFHYEEVKRGLKATHENVLNVEVNKRPSGAYDGLLPSGYYILSD